MSRTLGAKDKQKRKPREDRTRPAWSKSPVIADNNPDLPEGYNAKMIQFMVDITPTEDLDLHDVAEMERRFVNYLRICAERDIKIGNLAAYHAIGIDKDTAHSWVSRDPQANTPRVRFIKKVQRICAMTREGLMQDGKINPVTGIFWQKNYDGLKDQTETIIAPANPLGDSTDAETLRRRYLEQKETSALEMDPEKEAVPEVLEVSEGSQNERRTSAERAQNGDPAAGL